MTIIQRLRQCFAHEWTWRLYVVLTFHTAFGLIALDISDPEWDLLPYIEIIAYENTPVARQDLEYLAEEACAGESEEVYPEPRLPEWLWSSPRDLCWFAQKEKLRIEWRDKPAQVMVDWHHWFGYGTYSYRLTFWETIFNVFMVLIILLLNGAVPLFGLPFIVAKSVDYLIMARE